MPDKPIMGAMTAWPVTMQANHLLPTTHMHTTTQHNTCTARTCIGCPSCKALLACAAAPAHRLVSGIVARQLAAGAMLPLLSS